MRRPFALTVLLAACGGARGPDVHHGPIVAPASASPAPALTPSPPVIARPPPARPSNAPGLSSASTAENAPIVFEAAAPDGSWILFCEAAADTDKNGRLEVSVGPRGELGGDALVRRLVAGSGFDHAVDDVLASSGDGRRLMVQRGGRVSLIDAGIEQPLALDGADLRREPGPRGAHRTLVFGEQHLFYTRVNGRLSELLARDLATGAERVEYSGLDTIVRVEVHDQAAAVVLRIAGADTNGNGRFDWPFSPTNDVRRCEGPIQSYRAGRPGADSLGAVVIDRRTGTFRRVDDLVMPFGTGLLRRGGDGTLVLERDGKTRVVGDTACSGRVLFADPARDQLLLGCTDVKRPARFLVEHVGAVRTPLGIDVAALGFDEPPTPKRRAVPLYPGADAALFDLEKRRLVPLRPGDVVLQMTGARALIRRARSLVVFDLDDTIETELATGVDPFGGVLVEGDLVYASPFVVDVRAGAVIGQVPGRGLALARSGAVLVPAQPASAERLALAPLRWQLPE